jgi:nitrite reductase/ring-hydroxylating ferredoxin subunit/uncharacterized membrane protein
MVASEWRAAYHSTNSGLRRWRVPEPLPPVPALADRLGRTQLLDVPAGILGPLARRLTRSDPVKRVLSGAPLGHRLHPALTDIPIGCWTSATLLDLLAWRSGRTAARRLAGAGLLGALPTVASGLSDWSDTSGGDRRVGAAHAIGNSVAFCLELASWRARRRGHHVRGAAYGMSALAAVTAAGALGGHLVYTRRVGVDAEVPTAADGNSWRPAGRLADLVDGEPAGVEVGGARVVLVRTGDAVDALAAVCSHAGGPLDEGTVHEGTIVCPWHGSAFRLVDGRVERGPAATPQPAYDTRVRAGVVEIRPLYAADAEGLPAGGNS